VPFTTFQRAFNFGDRVGWLAVVSRPDARASVAEEKTLQLLKARHRVAPDDERAFGHWNLETEFSKIQGLFGGIRFLVWLVGAGTLAAGAIGVSNIMLIIVKERTKEIGIRRAQAKPSAVVSQIVSESVILASLAGYLGLVGDPRRRHNKLLLSGEDVLDPDVRSARRSGPRHRRCGRPRQPRPASAPSPQPRRPQIQ
jgi:putative ABC transport system permease protein